MKYLLGYSIPLSTFLSLYLLSGYSYITLGYAFGLVPILDSIIPINKENLSKEDAESIKNHRFYDWLLYLNFPMILGLLIYGFHIIRNQSLTHIELGGVISSLGILVGTNGINVAHELGHRNSRFDKTLAKIFLIPALYMHFYIEHNFGHHKNVGTDEDGASAKKNQFIYHFWATTIFIQYKSAWKIQFQLLNKKGYSFFSPKNDLFYYTLIQISYLFVLYLFLGIKGPIFGIIIAIFAILLLETINYIEHYGLRRKLENGKIERVKPMHSWNSDHVIGRYVLYELTRHSDHHHISSKKYQLLESKEESLHLPFGYPTSMMIALIPPLWFWLMNPKLEG
ncbi:MAG: hypothetical protein RIR51_1341 [Bacteroidota bacterium]